MSELASSALEGELGRGRLTELLLALQKQGTTGIVTVQGGQEIVAISVLQGELVSADALNRSLDDGLGEVLLRQGWVRPEDLSSLLSEQQVGGGRVVDLLLERGFLERERLLEALRLHVYDLLLEVFRWREGEFRFYAGDEVSHEEGIEPISVQEVLVRASRDLGDDGPLPQLFSIDTALERVVSPAGGAAPGSAGEGLLLELLAHPRSPSQLIRESGFTEYQTLFRLDRLRASGLIRVVSPTEDADLGFADVEMALADTDRVLELEEEQERLEAIEMTVAAPPQVARAASWAEGWTRFPLSSVVAVLWLLAGGLLVAGVGPGERTMASLVEPLQPALRESRLEARFQQLARAARLFFVATGRQPESVDQLASKHLMSQAFKQGQDGPELELSARDLSFVVGVDLDGEQAFSRTYFLAGDLVLDNSFELASAVSLGPALVLLD